MKLSIIVAVIIVIIIAFIVFRREQWRRKFATSTFGYFVNQQNLGAIFPQTGEHLILTQTSGKYVASMIDEKTKNIVPKPFPEFGGLFIVVPDLVMPGKSAPGVAPNLVLYACASATETIDPAKTQRLFAAIDSDTKMPSTKLGDAGSANATWKFVPVVMRTMDRARKLFGIPALGRGAFAEMPSKLPAWVAKNTAMTEALKAGTFTALLSNVKYPNLQYPSQAAKMKRWGETGIMMIHEGITADPQILIVPTGTDMVFRVFSLQTAVPNKETGRFENYAQLVATNGATFDLSKRIIDTDAARWTMTFPK